MKRIYLDYAATTPVHPDVLKEMKPFLSAVFGNPNSVHSFGQAASGALDAARERVASVLQANFREIIFTGSATEANNMAIRGVFAEAERRGVLPANPRLITTEIEHESILEPCRILEEEGVEIVYLPVDIEGRIKLGALRDALNERTVLVSIMYANNEIGTMQPIPEIGDVIRDFREENMSLFPLFHADAVQAIQFLDCFVGELGVDFMTLSAHKIYGPKGVGALYAKIFSQKEHKGIFLSPLINGGGQEFGLRSGTQNVAGISAFSMALEIAAKNRAKEAMRIAELRKMLWRGIKKILPNAEVNGIENWHHERSLPNILNVYFPGFDAADLLMKLDLAGVAVSSGSACNARFLKPSHVVRALGCEDARLKSNVRFSLGRQTTKAEINATIKILRNVLTTKREAA